MSDRLRLPGRWLAVAIVPVMAACGGGADDVEPEPEPAPTVLGPADGLELARADLDRVSDGDLAPDFTAVALDGDTITLSQYRGEKNVILFFYRGHW